MKIVKVTVDELTGVIANLSYIEAHRPNIFLEHSLYFYIEYYKAIQAITDEVNYYEANLKRLLPDTTGNITEYEKNIEKLCDYLLAEKIAEFNKNTVTEALKDATGSDKSLDTAFELLVLLGFSKTLACLMITPP